MKKFAKVCLLGGGGEEAALEVRNLKENKNYALRIEANLRSKAQYNEREKSFFDKIFRAQSQHFHLIKTRSIFLLNANTIYLEVCL